MTFADALYRALTDRYELPQRHVVVTQAPEGARIKTTHQAVAEIRDALDDIGLEWERRGMSYPTTFSVVDGGDLDR